MAKPKECEGCGCDRAILTSAKVLLNESGTRLSYNLLCIPCLLKQVGVDIWQWKDAPKETKDTLFGCVKGE